jgi:hypothetical protein
VELLKTVGNQSTASHLRQSLDTLEDYLLDLRVSFFAVHENHEFHGGMIYGPRAGALHKGYLLAKQAG